MKRHGFTGPSVAYVDDRRVVWSEGFGLADEARGVEATAATLYRAGSVSKLFTALAVMQLAERGRLDLDAPITDSVPTFDPRTRFGSIDGITLRTILSHHSGIPNAIRDGLFAREPDAFETVTARLAGHYAAYPPDTVFSYSNAGYCVVGHAVQNVTGRPFVDHVARSAWTELRWLSTSSPAKPELPLPALWRSYCLSARHCSKVRSHG